MSGSQVMVPHVTNTRSNPCGDGTACGVSAIRLNEPRAIRQAKLVGQCTGRHDRGGGKIQPDHCRATLRKTQTVATEMTLQMQHTLAGNRRQLDLFDRIQPPLPRPQVRQVITARPQMHPDPLVPVRPIGAGPF